MVYKELILGMYQNQKKENLKRVAWELDVGHKDRTRIKSLVKNSESPIRYLVHNHLQVSRLIGYNVIHQRKCLLSVKKRCTKSCLLGVEKRYRFDKSCFVKWCTKS